METAKWVGSFDAGGEGTTDPVEVTGVLLRLAADIKGLSKATVFCRVLIGRYLIFIQKKELWRRMERRDYRNDPEGKPLWLRASDRMYSSWYSFIEEGFENITGMHRQTAYSAIKLAHSVGLASLSRDELYNLKRLANALELVAAERAGVRITPELILQAQDMRIQDFRQALQSGGHEGRPQRTSVLGTVMKFLRAAGAKDPNVLNEFSDAIRRAMVTAAEDPACALKSILGGDSNFHPSAAQNGSSDLGLSTV